MNHAVLEYNQNYQNELLFSLMLMRMSREKIYVHMYSCVSIHTYFSQLCLLRGPRILIPQ